MHQQPRGSNILKAASRGRKNGKPVHRVVLGLSHAELDRLRGGRPIQFDATELGLPDVEIMIFAGETEQSMARDVADLIGPKAKTLIDQWRRD